jgi:Domain of Unknown Function with PDB structure (DUF3857)
MRIHLIIGCWLLVWVASSGALHAQNYTAATIPATLRENADAVIRQRTTEVWVTSPESSRIRHHSIVTVLRSNASDELKFVVCFGKKAKFSDLKVILYDANGKAIKQYKEKDFEDVVYTDQVTMKTDYKCKRLEVTPPTLPVTAEIMYEIESNSFVSFPDFSAYNHFNRSLEHAEYIIRHPATYPIRHLSLRGAPEAEQLDGGLKWTYKSLPALVAEPMCPPIEALTPEVMIAPTLINVDDHPGNISDWQQMGAWEWGLLQGRDQLPPATVLKIKELVAPINDPVERICAVYGYMQQRTRYVSIQLGIGGWQPFTAAEVDATGYGDCKALTNYTRALLAAADVPSYYASVYGGRQQKQRYHDFCSFGQDNHVILCVPVPNQDTLWLECTSQQQPCTSQGRFTSNRTAILVTGQGGQVVPTRHYDAADNREDRQINIQLQPDGSATGHLTVHAHELASEDWEGFLHIKSTDAANHVAEIFPIKDAKPGTFSHKMEVRPHVVSVFEADFAYSRLASTQAGMLIFPVCPLDPIKSPANVKNRQYDVVTGWGYTEADQFTYNIPAGKTVDFLPPALSIDSPFGTYKRTCTSADQTFKVERTLVWRGGQYAPAQWKDLLAFIKQVNAADAEKVVLK